MDDEVPRNLEYVGSFYNPESIPTERILVMACLEKMTSIIWQALL